jgi:hypothetical protein
VGVYLEELSPDSLGLTLVKHGQTSLVSEIFLHLDVGVLVRGVGCVRREPPSQRNMYQVRSSSSSSSCAIGKGIAAEKRRKYLRSFPRQP